MTKKELITAINNLSSLPIYFANGEEDILSPPIRWHFEAYAARRSPLIPHPCCLCGVRERGGWEVSLRMKGTSHTAKCFTAVCDRCKGGE